MREPIVAGRFYPADRNELLSTIKSYMQEDGNRHPAPAFAAIAPHAGYIYSGQLAAKTLGAVAIPKNVILIGPNHTGEGQLVSVSKENWRTPLGDVEVNDELADGILSHHDFAKVDESAHKFEHSLEVQLPFLQHLQPNLSIVPITVQQLSYEQCDELALAISAAITSHHESVLIVASTDMNHYESRSISKKKDCKALTAIQEMDPVQLYSTVRSNNISMCGVIPVVVTLLLSKKLGANKARIIDYIDSGVVSGDIQHVVGYTGVIIE